MTVIDLLRHGELEGGIRYRGSSEEALTGAGRAHMDAVWRHLEGKVEAIVTSPLGRCRVAAGQWADGADIVCDVEERIREMHYGEWEGLTRDQVEERFPGMLARWRADPTGMQPPGGEFFDDFAARVRAGMTHILRKYAGRHVLLVTHSGPLRVILSEALGAGPSGARRFMVPYGAWSRILQDGDRSYVEYINRKPLFTAPDRAA